LGKFVAKDIEQELRPAPIEESNADTDAENITDNSDNEVLASGEYFE
jgi:hypothetical protein